LQSGDMVLLDPRLPFSARFSSGSRFLIAMVPRKELEARVGNTREMVSRTLSALRGANTLTSSFLEMLPSQADRSRRRRVSRIGPTEQRIQTPCNFPKRHFRFRSRPCGTRIRWPELRSIRHGIGRPTHT
jgi:hypothetical protein